MKVLIGIPSPRDIPEFRDAISEIKNDQIWVKYYDEYTAYRYIRRFFLKYKEYTHLCIIPDDLIVKKEQYEKLIYKVLEKDFQILSGVFNRDYEHLDELTHTSDDNNNNSIQQVEAEGFGCCFMRRDVVEKISFDGIVSFDVTFAAECKKLGIPIFVDTSVVLLHLARRLGDTWEKIGIGLFLPYIAYVKYGYES